MKMTFFAGAFLVVVMSLLGFAGQARADDGPIDCSNGCTIVTCDASNCMVWQCDASGCRIIGSYRRPVPPTRPKIAADGSEPPQAFSKVCEAGSQSACAIKRCDGATCQVSAFDGAEFVPIAEIDNVEYLLQQAAPRLKR